VTEKATVTDGRSRRRADTRQRLYEAAVELIAEQGFSATTVDDIALRAKVAKGTVYYNFKSKNDLFEELLRHGIELLTDEFRAAVQGLPPREAVGALVRTQLEYIRRYRAFAFEERQRVRRGGRVIALDLAPQLGVDKRALVAGDVGKQQLELFANAIVETVRTFAHLGRRLQGP